jgi:hypothetical protein
MQFKISKFPHFGHQNFQEINNLQNRSILVKFVITIVFRQLLKFTITKSFIL